MVRVFGRVQEQVGHVGQREVRKGRAQVLLVLDAHHPGYVTGGATDVDLRPQCAPTVALHFGENGLVGRVCLQTWKLDRVEQFLIFVVV